MMKSFNDLIVSDNIDEVNISPETMSSSFLAFYCERGALQFSVEGEMYHVGEGDIIISTPRNIVGMYMRTPDLQGKVISAGESVYDETLPGVFQIDPNWWKKLFYLRRNPVVHATEFQSKLFLAYFNLLMVYMEDSDNPYRQRIIRLTSQAVAVELLHALETETVNQNTCDTSQKDRLFQRFMSILSRPTNTEREVRAYAEQLLVTSKYLSAVCKEKSGRTAMDWITESTVGHIKYYLLQTDLSVKEIAFKLDFPDVSFFCKYVKKHLGKSPMDYRKTMVGLSEE
ncbi:MAG: AraC family transcriptional regulator [Bacteroidales bacterium]|nr:AraC family transcriptional regulator [Bacteroidales bacterium]